MIQFNEITLPLDITISEPIDYVDLLLKPFDFDREGFSLSKLEKEYYEANGFMLNFHDEFDKEINLDGYYSPTEPWVKCVDHVFLYVDHSYILYKCQFVGKALEQVLEYSKKNPQLLRLAKSKCKYGLDISLDYINEEFRSFKQLFHLEYDSYDLIEFQQHKSNIEDVLNNLDRDIANFAIKFFNPSHDNDFRCQYFGLPKSRVLNTLI
jgi:hypothetical protein